ncbi:ABC transporter permease [Deferribacteraceae bacterium V6Fe1]|nr:ABC transporter permease [Deferribacteraceae bacterium V6Fe1]
MISIIIDATIRAGTSILYATLGEIIIERSGIINLGIEGLMLIGALAGFYTTYTTESLILGVFAAVLVAGLAGLIHGILCTYFKGNQIVSGLALTMFGVGITAVLGKSMVGQTIVGFKRIEIPVLSKIPIIGNSLFNQDILVYLSIFLVFLISFFLYKTVWGLNLRTVGENPYAADVSGIDTYKYRLAATFVGSGLAGLGGAYLSLAYTPLWIENMTAGRGWIAVALVIFSSWSCKRALFGAYFFGGISAIQLRFQAMGTTISAHILQMLPYIFTIIVLIIATIKIEKGSSSQPESLGLVYDREDRK